MTYKQFCELPKPIVLYDYRTETFFPLALFYDNTKYLLCQKNESDPNTIKQSYHWKSWNKMILSPKEIGIKAIYFSIISLLEGRIYE